MRSKTTEKSIYVYYLVGKRWSKHLFHYMSQIKVSLLPYYFGESTSGFALENTSVFQAQIISTQIIFFFIGCLRHSFKKNLSTATDCSGVCSVRLKMGQNMRPSFILWSLYRDVEK